jgi:hypothetical protein
MAISSAAESFAAEPDWISVGLVLAILGSFLLGNAILFRPPRILIEELFGVRNLRLPAIREYVFHRVQVGVGFTWLLAGFASMLFGRLRQSASEPVLPVFWVGCIVLVTVGLLACGWWWSSRSFRGHVRDHLLAHPPDFEGNLGLAREVGALFGVESSDDDSVQAYLERLRTTIGLPPPARGPRRGPGAPQPEEVEESVL